MRITAVTGHVLSSAFRYGNPAGAGGNLHLRNMDTLLVRVDTDAGITGWGEGFGFTLAETTHHALTHLLAPACIGEAADDIAGLMRKLHRRFHNFGRNGPMTFALSGLDIALWDIAGKAYDAPVYELLGGFRTSLPAYASTYHGDENGGLHSPEAFADFAVQCKEMGYPAFKIHGWGCGPIEREAAAVLATREAAGKGMDLMLDPACEYNTFGDALKVGKACDEADFFWYEDPYKDGGQSAFAHRKLRQMIRTPILLGEHVRGLELHMDQVLSDGTDFVRADADYDMGITGVMKRAHAAEALGLDCEIHAPGPAHRHCMASIRNTNYYELGLVAPNLDRRSKHCPVYVDDYSDDLESVDERGCVSVPQGAGLGVEINWDWVAKNETGKTVYD
jgi:L-alanine-DL-glutamate epimerase-like enolase superfamily enzyme